MKSILRDIVHKYFSNFAFFYRHLRYRVFVVLALSIMVGVMDGLGLAMFLPLLEMVAGDTEVTGEQMGNLAFLVNGLQALGLSLNLSVVLMVMLIFFTLKGAFKFLEQYKSVVYKQFFIRNIRESNIKLLSNYDYYNFVNADAGRIQNTMSGEVQKVTQAFKEYMKLMQHSVLIIVYTVLAFMANPQFALLVAIGGILTNFAFNNLYKKTKGLSRVLTKSNHGFQGLLIQQVAQFKYLKATGLIRSYANKLIEKTYEIEDSQRKIGVLGAIMSGIREPLLIGVVLVVILVQINFLGGTLGLIILSILFFYRALTAVMQVQTHWNKFLSNIGSLENIEAFIEELKKGKERTGKLTLQQFSKSIRLEQVSFYYGDIPILLDINLELHKNRSIAFVGESGSGKTTLMNIISGLLKPTSGSVTIDGVDAKQLNIATFQKRIGYITQDPVIFNDTIYNNVTFWAPKTAENILRFEDSLRKASIRNFVMEEQPDKEETQLGNNGINLSGGQKQRISIARELFKDVDFLFLDEATSALDSETEKEIQDNIDQLKGQYTIIMIAHRLSTIKNADRVVVLNKGRIERIGTYKELIGESESFKRMVELQEV
ncbi:ATP-binding cassette, subfamily B, MsbA [Cyclonatronum proteinivorum]|uniref:ATP-binding cassette, subfamily B, MsbA n=1 Tax=Cyclonatronum proteinivorum TaxID=1457365 RepID=A0A345UMJ8_9BACT|nr:ATP-binding cassette, subfamily B, MsbA [Cyclonatronum proteinivorum]